MSALKQVFVRVHFRYDQDRYAEDLERFATWLLAAGYPNKSARTHLYRAQQVLHTMCTDPIRCPLPRASTCRTVDPQRGAGAFIRTPCGTPQRFIY